MTAFNDFESLIAEVEDDMRHIVESITEAIWFIVTENIQKIVYDPFEPNEYERQGWDGGFIGSWIHSPISRDAMGNYFSVVASYDAIKEELGMFSHQEMTLDPERAIHAQFVPPFDDEMLGDAFLHILDRTNASSSDRRPIMDRAIAEGTDYDFSEGKAGNWWTKPRDYWNPTLRSVIDQDIINEISLKYFKDNNIRLVKR